MSSEDYERFTISTFVKFLGKPAAGLLATSPFDRWAFEREVEEDLPEGGIDYTFSEQGLSVSCDDEDNDEKVRTIFLYPRVLDQFDVRLIDISLSFNRLDVLEHLGTPSTSGAPRISQFLGPQGAWDRYDRPDYSLHVEYQTDADQIEMITLMRHDVVP